MITNEAVFSVCSSFWLIGFFHSLEGVVRIMYTNFRFDSIATVYSPDLGNSVGHATIGAGWVGAR